MTHPSRRHPLGVLLTTCTVALLLAACDQSLDTGQPLTAISSFDGKPAVRLSAEEFFLDHRHLGDVAEELVNHRDAIRDAFVRSGKANDDSGVIPLFELSSGSGKAGGFPLSTHLVVREGSRSEQFILGLARIGEESLGKGAQDVQYVALDPDTFHEHEDETGQEVYPYEIPATALDGSGETVTVVFTEQGVYHVKDSGKTGARGGVVFLAALPACDAQVEPTEECDEGGGGGGYDDGDSDSGSNTSDPDALLEAPAAEYLSLLAVKLNDSGEDGAAELQMYLASGDNYTQQYSRNWRYRFDARNVFDPGAPRHGTTTVNRSARRTVVTSVCVQGQTILNEWVRTQDVNYKNTEYRFENLDRWVHGYRPDCSYGYFQLPGAERITGFPIMALGNDYQRAVMAETDHVYNQFSRRRSGYWGGAVNTYDMETNTWGSKFTEMNAESNYYGSSDDVIPNSGIRRVSIQSVRNRTALGAAFETYTAGVAYKYGFIRQSN